MAIFKCKMCGGTLEITAGTSVIECEYCGVTQTLPKLDDDRRANMYDRANHFRRNNDYDKAMGIFEQILNDDNTDAEAYWSLVLCRYGIEYVEDPATRKRVPTVNRAQFTSIFADEDYKSALQYADGYQRSVYEAEAKAIDEIQKGILAISQKEEPFDVFICYKETDNNGRRTQDSVLANDLYHQLTQEGFKVFFSRITLEDKLGTAYEPYIFAALNSSKVMVVLGTRPEYFNAVWVKNEWSRYLALIRGGAKKILIPAYRDMDPYDLPEEFSHLQAQDMGKLGFMQDLIRGIKKLTQEEAPKTTVVKETVTASANASTASLLKRVFMFLEDGEWERADDFCEQVLNLDPECADAYLGKLMADLKVAKRELLQDCANPFDANNNYKKALRFGDEKLRAALTGYIEHINTRNLNEYLEGVYVEATAKKESATFETQFKEAAALFAKIPDYKDSNELYNLCLEQAEIVRKNDIYNNALQHIESGSISSLTQGIQLLKSIGDWKNASQIVTEAEEKLNINSSRIQELLEDVEQFSNTLRLVKDKQKQLEKQKSELGIFNKKEKKRVNESLLALDKELNAAKDVLSKAKCSLAQLYFETSEYTTSAKYLLDTDTTDAQILKTKLLQINPSLSVLFAKVGDIVTFGTFAGEKIRWDVVSKTGKKVMLLSTNILDCVCFIPHSHEKVDSYLQDAFSNSFSKDELSLIDSTRNNNVFLLTESEMSSVDKTIRARFYPTKYAIDKYIKTRFPYMDLNSIDSSLFKDIDCWLYTKNYVHSPNFGTYGSIFSIAESEMLLSQPHGIRPAMWIDLSAID